MRVLFLDCDGVLNSTDYPGFGNDDSGLMGLDAFHVNFLEKIVLETGCQIVVSSVWRKRGIGPKSRFGKQLSKHSTICFKSVIGKTCDNFKKEDGTWSLRGDEIQKWIDDNSFDGDFLIVDDSSDMGHLMDHLVRTNLKNGLTEDIAQDIIDKFLSKESKETKNCGECLNCDCQNYE